MSFGAIGIGATIAGGIVSAVGDLWQGKAQQGVFNYQSGLALQRQVVAKQNANYSITSGETQALSSGLRTGQVVAQERAGQAAGNIDPGSGTARMVRASQTKVGQMDEANIRTSAARRAFGFEVEAASDVAQSNVDKAAGENARTASRVAATSSILGAAGSAASKWSQASQAGVPGFDTGIHADSGGFYIGA